MSLHYTPADRLSWSVLTVCGRRHVAAPWTTDALAVVRAMPECRECAAAARRDLDRGSGSPDRLLPDCAYVEGERL